MDKLAFDLLAVRHPILLQLIAQLLDLGLKPKQVASRYATQYPILSDLIEPAARHIMENAE